MLANKITITNNRHWRFAKEQNTVFSRTREQFLFFGVGIVDKGPIYLRLF